MQDQSSTPTSLKSHALTRIEWATHLIFLFGLIMVAITAVAPAMRVESHYSLSQFLPAKHQLITSDLEIRRKYFLDEYQPILVTVGLPKGDWIQTSNLKALGDVTNNLRVIGEVKGALSLGTVELANQSADSVSVGTLVSIPDETVRRARVMNDRFLKPLLISEEARRALIVVSLRKALTTQTQKDLTEEIRARVAYRIPGAEISVGGVPAIQGQLSSMVKNEMTKFMGLALIAATMALLFVFGSVSSLLVPFFSIFVSNLFVLAFMAKAGIAMTVLSATIPVLVSVTVLSLCIHTMLRYAEIAQHDSANDKFGLVLKTFKELLLPNFLTSLTTAFGFGTLLMTKVPVIRDFGLAVSVSVLISWLATTLVMIPLLTMLPLPRVRAWVINEAGWADWIMNRARPVVAAVAVGCMALAIAGRDLHWSARLFDDLPEKEEARRATEEIDRDMGGTIPLEVSIVRPASKSPWNDPRALESLDRLTAKIRSLPEVGSAVGLQDLLRLALGDPKAKIPATSAALAENWFLMSMAEDSQLKRYLTNDGAGTRISVRMKDMEGDRIEKAMAQIEAEARRVFPDAEVSTGGLATIAHQLNNELSKSLLYGFWEALAVITILLAFVFRSVRWTLTAILPNLVPAGVLIGVLALAKTPIKPGVAIVFSIALGIAFNNTVYLLQRLKVLMKESGRGPAEEIGRTLRLEGNPCLVATLCLLAGFGIFLISDFGINRTFGIYMLVSLFSGLVGDLAFLPALLKIMPRILVSTGKPLQTKLTTEPLSSSGEEMRTDSIHAAEVIPLNPADSSTTQSEDSMTAKEILPRVAACFVAVAFTAFSTSAHAANPKSDANTILKSVERGLISNDERAFIKVKVVESNGTSKERQIEIKRKSGAKNQVLVRLKAPSDVSGIGLLSVSTGKNEDQWLYMPSQRKARRIVSGNKSQKFLDTEFNLEDFSASTYSRFTNRIVKEERAPSAAVAVIESLAAKGTQSSYSKILTWVDLNSYQVQKSEYYDGEGKLLKTMVFRNYKKFGTAWRAQTIEVRNMQTQRSTVLQMAGLKLNSGIPDREFTQSALEQGD